MEWLTKLSDRTMNIASMYTGTFIVIMVINQLVFFGFCLNPILIAAPERKVINPVEKYR